MSSFSSTPGAGRVGLVYFSDPVLLSFSLSAYCQILKFSVKAKNLISKLIISFLALYKIQLRGICQGTEVKEVRFDTQN